MNLSYEIFNPKLPFDCYCVQKTSRQDKYCKCKYYVFGSGNDLILSIRFDYQSDWRTVLLNLIDFVIRRN